MSEREPVTCWCGAVLDADDPSLTAFVTECDGGGSEPCECGGDGLCICHNHGHIACLGCEYCCPGDDYDEYYDDYNEDYDDE